MAAKKRNTTHSNICSRIYQKEIHQFEWKHIISEVNLSHLPKYTRITSERMIISVTFAFCTVGNFRATLCPCFKVIPHATHFTYENEFDLHEN